MYTFGFQTQAVRGLLICLAGTTAVLAPVDGPYLQAPQALEGEDDEVEPNEIGVGSGNEAPFADSPEETALVRDRFESMLRQRYAGTFSFYARLPDRSRQEILGQYRKGADIAQLRQTIIDRFNGS